MRSWEDLRAKLDMDDYQQKYWRLNYPHHPTIMLRKKCFWCVNNISNFIISKLASLNKK